MTANPSPVLNSSTLSSSRLSVQARPRLGLAPLTTRIKVRRECQESDRLLELAVILDGFEDQYSAIDLEGCDSPGVFDFVRELRLPGNYTVVARIQPANVMASTTLELH
jgi:hypothetical protein